MGLSSFFKLRENVGRLVDSPLHRFFFKMSEREIGKLFLYRFERKRNSRLAAVEERVFFFLKVGLQTGDGTILVLSL